MFKKIAVIIPTFNEAESLSQIIQVTARVFKNDKLKGYVLVTDANSSDGTAELSDKLAKKYKGDFQVKVIHEKKKEGLGRAYVGAFKYCIKDDADVVIQMDADFSHDPHEIPAMIRALNRGADLVIGSRYIRGGTVENWGLLRKFISLGGSLYSRFILGIPIKDLTGGFNAYNTHMLKRLNPDTFVSNGYSFQIEHKYKTFKKGGKIVEIPIIFKDRTVGSSKMSNAIIIEAMKNVWLLRMGKM